MFFCIGYYSSGKLSLPKLGTIDDVLDLERISVKTSNSTRGDAAFPDWLVIKTPLELIVKAPIRAIYFLFSPFPWDITKKNHLIGMFDGLLYLGIMFLIIKNLQTILSDPALKIIFIILICYFFVFGLGVGNFGTGLRHRAKFIIALILLAAPLLPKLVFFKKEYKT